MCTGRRDVRYRNIPLFIADCEKRMIEHMDIAEHPGVVVRAYSYQQIAREFGVHFTTVGRIVRQPMKRVSATHVIR